MNRSEKLYYSIREVSEQTGIKAHVLRYWESQFSMLRPLKGSGGNRRYRPRDVAMVLTIRDLLHEKGFTIAGARKLLQTRMRGRQVDLPEGLPAVGEGGPKEPQQILADIRKALKDVRDRLAAEDHG